VRRRSFVAGVIPAMALPGCSTGQMARMGTAMDALGMASGVLNVDKSINLYGVAKVIADAAMIAVPGSAAVVSVILAMAEPLLADAQAGTPTSVASANMLVHHAGALILATAPATVIEPKATT